jgi:cell division transport system ATP-binding protein
VVLENVLQAENMGLKHGDRLVLENVNFTLGKGEFCYLIGRTGSGKTTLLRSLYADLIPSEGALLVTGKDVAKQISLSEKAALRRNIGIIFQDFQLLPDRSVHDNLLFVLKATGWSDKVKINTRIQQVLTEVGLSNISAKMPYQLSGGEQQRVCIARALLNEPRLLLADEPTGNLDPEVSYAILELFRLINRRGTAVLMATHNHEFLRKFPARILQCTEGTLRDSVREDIAFIG